MLLAGQVLVLVRGETQAQVDLAPVLLLLGVGLLEVPPAAHPAGWKDLHWILETAKQQNVFLDKVMLLMRMP